jgi:hypothetical protein
VFGRSLEMHILPLDAIYSQSINLINVFPDLNISYKKHLFI